MLVESLFVANMTKSYEVLRIQTGTFFRKRDNVVHLQTVRVSFHSTDMTTPLISTENIPTCLLPENPPVQLSLQDLFIQLSFSELFRTCWRTIQLLSSCQEFSTIEAVFLFYDVYSSRIVYPFFIIFLSSLQLGAVAPLMRSGIHRVQKYRTARITPP